MRDLQDHVQSNAIQSWDRASTIQQDAMVAIYRESLLKEYGCDIEDGLTEDEQYLSLLCMPLQNPKNALALGQRAAYVMRETHKPEIEDFIEEVNADSESISEHYAYQLQRFNQLEAQTMKAA